jgi:flavin reductase
VGTHSIFIVELAGVALETPEPGPGLAYFNRRYHALGAAAA